jgi:hypothetical protein
MRRLIRLLPLSLIAIVMLALPAPALAFPPIYQAEAEEDVEATLREYPGWRYRQWGYVDCDHGRIRGNVWACEVAWGAGRRCREGRIRITNLYYLEGGGVHYHWSSQIRRC